MQDIPIDKMSITRLRVELYNQLNLARLHHDFREQLERDLSRELTKNELLAKETKTLIELVEGVSPLVESFSTKDTPAQEQWRKDWLMVKNRIFTQIDEERLDEWSQETNEQE